MKNLLIAAVLMITLTANSQVSLNKTGKELYNDFKFEGIEYKHSPQGRFYLERYPHSDVIVNYYLDADSICTSILILAITKEAADYIINTYNTRKYFKVYDGWMLRDNGIVYSIYHYKDESGYFFYWH
jgi:hypothetical protein